MFYNTVVSSAPGELNSTRPPCHNTGRSPMDNLKPLIELTFLQGIEKPKGPTVFSLLRYDK